MLPFLDEAKDMENAVSDIEEVFRKAAKMSDNRPKVLYLDSDEVIDKPDDTADTEAGIIKN